MQPLQCDLQPQIQETHRATHTGTTTRCRTQRRNQNDPSRNRRTQEVPGNQLHNHAAITRAYCYVMSSLTPQPPTTLHCVYSYVMSSFAPQPHTTLQWVYCYVMSSLTLSVCILMWCQVSHHPSLSVLFQVKVIRNSEDCFPTSFDNSCCSSSLFWHAASWVLP